MGFKHVTVHFRSGMGPHCTILPWRLMDVDGFLRAMGDFPIARVGDLPGVLVDLWMGNDPGLG